MSVKGIIAAGHECTAEAARRILGAGGNAFDAVVAANFAAGVTEPVLSSLGGGGFLMAHTADGREMLYDFFVQTPMGKLPPGELEFRPIIADFGTTTQEFHIGMGSMATPGMVAGMFRIHRELGSLPMRELVKPAVELAREGVVVTPFHSYVFEVVKAIYASSPSSRVQYGSPDREGELIGEGERLAMPDLADTLEALAEEGEGLFYRGEIAQRIVRECRERGGHLAAKDLEGYRVERRTPFALTYRDARLLFNPPPSCGGLLIAFALKLLERLSPAQNGFGSLERLSALASVMELTNRARMDHLMSGKEVHHMEQGLFEPDYLESYHGEIRGRFHFPRGTTHINVIDAAGNIAGMSVSNGEGCGHILPGTGVMLNNMLGEEDLNPSGFHGWGVNQRISSMMCPSLLFMPDGETVTTGSGGSNRIRTAILQLLLNLIDFRMPIAEAVIAPRIHYEDGLLSVEGGFEDGEVERLVRAFPEAKVWADRNLFFGGAHSASYRSRGLRFEGAVDPRRAGVCVTA